MGNALAVLNGIGKVDKTHREFWPRYGIGKTCLWKKYILLYECKKSRGKRIFEIIHWPFELPPN